MAQEKIPPQADFDDGSISDGRSGFWFCILDVDVMRDNSISFCARALYALLATYVDTKNRSWSIKIDTLANTAGISRRQVQYALKELTVRGYLKITPIYKGGRRSASKYTIIGHDAAPGKSENKEEKIERTVCTPRHKGEAIKCTSCTYKGAPPAHLKDLPEPDLLEPKEPPINSPQGGGEKKPAKAEKLKVKRTEADEKNTRRFDLFWKAYPGGGRGSKQKALRMWRAALSGKGRESPALPDQLMAAAKNYARECAEEGRESRYIMHTSTFLGGDERWKDYLTAAPLACGISPGEFRDVDVEQFKDEYGVIDAIAYERARRGL